MPWSLFLAVLLVVALVCLGQGETRQVDGEEVHVSVALQKAEDAILVQDYSLAEKLSREIITRHGDAQSAPAFHILSLVYQEHQKFEEAYKFATRALSANPRRSQFHTQAGNCAFQLGDWETAENHFQTSVSLENREGFSTDPGAYLQYGKYLEFYKHRTLKGSGADPGSLNVLKKRIVVLYSQYLQTNPGDHEVQNNLGNMFFDLEMWEKAAIHYKNAIKHGNFNARSNYALLLSRKGEAEESVRLQWEMLNELEGKRPSVRTGVKSNLYNNIASALNKLGKTNATAKRLAQEMWEKAIETDPYKVSALDALSNILIDQGDHEGAIKMLKRLEEAALKKNDLSRASAVRIKWATLIPRVYRSTEEMLKDRFRYNGALDDLLQRARRGDLAISNPYHALTDLGFYAAPNGFHENVRRAQFSEILRLSAPHLEYNAPHTFSPEGQDILFERVVAEHSANVKRTKLRVGFFSKYFREHSVGKLLRGVIGELSRIAMFEVYCIVPNVEEDEFTREIKDTANVFVQIKSENYAVLREEIGKLKLDVLVYGEVGMAHNTFLTAFSRLAHRQVVFWGHGWTTGLKEIDYFVSSQQMESTEAQARYTERLYLMPSITTYFKNPIAAKASLGGHDFGINMSHFGPGIRPHLYLLPTSIYKIHPLMDKVIAKVLQRDKWGLVILVKSRRKACNDLLNHRFNHSMPPELKSRIIWINRVPLDMYLALLKLGDVLMLSFPSSSGVTVMESLSVGTPYVVYEGLSLGMGMRIEKGLIRELGIGESCCVAHTIDEYVDKLVLFGRDKLYRDSISQQIDLAKGRLFENKNVIYDWVEFLQYISRTRKPKNHRLLTTPAIKGKTWDPRRST